MDDAGALTVIGRADDVLITGGAKVSAAAVAEVIEGLPDVQAALVAGIDDPEWGTRVCAAVVGSAAEADIEARVRRALGAPAVPRHLVRLEALPLLPNGKPDRLAVTDLLSRAAAEAAGHDRGLRGGKPPSP